MKRTLTTLLILLTCSVAHANPYQYEGGIAYGQVDYDVLGAFEDKSVIGHLNYYFAPVDPGFYPYKEAAFANRASRVHAGYRQVRGEFTRKKVASLGGEAFVGGFYAYANVDFNKWDRNRYVLDKFHPEFGKDDYSKNNTADGQLAVGYMPVDNWLLSASFDFVKDQQTLSHDARKDQKTYAINSKYLLPLENNRALNAEASVGYMQHDKNTMLYRIGADFYMTQKFGAGIWLRMPDRSGYHNEKGLRASYFVIPELELYADYVDNFGYEDHIKYLIMGVNARY